MNTSQLKPVEWSDEALEDAINGKFTVTRMGQDVPYKLTAQEKEALHQAKQHGYILFPKRTNLRNAFCKWCEIHALPYVYAEQRGRYASVEMDLIFCDHRQEYNKNPLFGWKLFTVTSAVGNLKTVGVGGTYNAISGIRPEHAEFVAQSFVAIYKQFQGEKITAPAFPEGWQDRPVATLEEAKRLRYAHCTKDDRWLSLYWRQFCLAYDWPRIELVEHRKGSAKVKVDLFPALKFFTHEMEEQIAELGHRCGIKDVSERTSRRDPVFFLNEQSLYMIDAAPLDLARDLATGVAKILDDAGYFPPVDESWHK